MLRTHIDGKRVQEQQAADNAGAHGMESISEVAARACQPEAAVIHTEWIRAVSTAHRGCDLRAAKGVTNHPRFGLLPKHAGSHSSAA